ncbi:MAG: FIST N-terminal domain-containing protein [Myxococcota bacterium]
MTAPNRASVAAPEGPATGPAWSAGAGFSAAPGAAEATRAACEQALGGAIGRADAALLFAGPAHRDDADRLVATAREVLGTETIVGSLAHGVLGAGQELEGGAGVSVLAVQGLHAEPLWLADLAGHEDLAADEVRAGLTRDPRPEDLVVLIPDPRALDPDALLGAVREAAGPALVVGAGAGDPISEAPLLWSARELDVGGLAGLVLRGARRARVGVTQACRPVTELLTVTKAQGPWVLELEGRPALDAFREAAGPALADDLARAAQFTFAALPRDPAAPLAPGGYLVRNIAGLAPDANAFAIPGMLEKGDSLAFVHREPETARDDLKAVLAGLAEEPPGLALYFDCCARGAGFFGVPGLEAAYLEQAFGAAPVAGMFGSCELGPIGGRPELLTYTGVVALLDA